MFLTGDVMVDALEYNKEIIRRRSKILEKYSLTPGKYLILTVHRPSNTDHPDHMEHIEAIGDCGLPTIFQFIPDEKVSHIFWIVGPNAGNIIPCDPLGYLDMLAAMGSAEEDPDRFRWSSERGVLLSVPCITLRENTEWVETVEAGWNVLVGADREKIGAMVREFLPSGGHPDLFGSGASGKITEVIGG